MDPDLKAINAAWWGLNEVQKLHILIMAYEGLLSVGIDDKDEFLLSLLSNKLNYLSRHLVSQDGKNRWHDLPDEKKRKMVMTVYKLAFVADGATKDEVELTSNFLGLSNEQTPTS